jgi:hypothetical protein
MSSLFLESLANTKQSYCLHTASPGNTNRLYFLLIQRHEYILTKVKKKKILGIVQYKIVSILKHRRIWIYTLSLSHRKPSLSIPKNIIHNTDYIQTHLENLLPPFKKACFISVNYLKRYTF